MPALHVMPEQQDVGGKASRSMEVFDAVSRCIPAVRFRHSGSHILQAKLLEASSQFLLLERIFFLFCLTNRRMEQMLPCSILMISNTIHLSSLGDKNVQIAPSDQARRIF